MRQEIKIQSCCLYKNLFYTGHLEVLCLTNIA